MLIIILKYRFKQIETKLLEEDAVISVLETTAIYVLSTVRNNDMDMTGWFEYFVTGLRSQMEEIQEKGKQLIKQDAALQKIKKSVLNTRQEKAIKYLLKNGTISVNEYQSVASCIRRTAQRDLGNLIEKGVIKIVAKSPTDPTKHYILL